MNPFGTAVAHGSRKLTQRVTIAGVVFWSIDALGGLHHSCRRQQRIDTLVGSVELCLHRAPARRSPGQSTSPSPLPSPTAAALCLNRSRLSCLAPSSRMPVGRQSVSRHARGSSDAISVGRRNSWLRRPSLGIWSPAKVPRGSSVPSPAHQEKSRPDAGSQLPKGSCVRRYNRPAP